MTRNDLAALKLAMEIASVVRRLCGNYGQS